MNTKRTEPTLRTVAAGAVVGAAGLLLLAACGGSNGYGASGSSAPTGGAAASGGVAVEQTTFGTALTDASGRSLYVLTADSPNHSTCVGSCVSAWPPVAATTMHGAGVMGAMGSLMRSDGTTQLTVAGHPVYTYAGDSGAHGTNGQGIASFGGTWWLVSPAGSPIASTQPGGSAPAGGGRY